jgi:2-C-methyl-D-erythritol 2,4-cyclodiphosphate synthase
MIFRVGQGLDVHAFAEGDHVMLGGAKIPHDQGLEAHSDGDVVLHALCDALLGAAAMGDLGHHFPPDDPQWADADSRLLLETVVDRLLSRGWRVGNVDVTVVCERPRLADHIQEMRDNIAEALGVDDGEVSIKATTTERLGFCGRGEGIAASAVALISKIQDQAGQ